MNGHCLSKHVVSNASHLNSIGREKTASIDESWSLESYRVISFAHDQHSNNSFVTINYEVSSKFITIFLSFGQFFLWKTMQIAEFTRDHNWNISKTNGDFLSWSIIDLPSDSCPQWSRVSQWSESTFIWQHFVIVVVAVLKDSGTCITWTFRLLKRKIFKPNFHLGKWICDIISTPFSSSHQFWLRNLSIQHVLIDSW